MDGCILGCILLKKIKVTPTIFKQKDRNHHQQTKKQRSEEELTLIWLSLFGQSLGIDGLFDCLHPFLVSISFIVSVGVVIAVIALL